MQGNNQRLAKNTLFLYFRMGIIMLVTLYTSRIVLAELGIDDYGVYIVVGGVVTMFSFINNSMTTSTQRYLNYALGNKDSSEYNLKEIFSTSLSIHLTIALIVVCAAETIGLWFVNNKLIIPANSMFAANIVYQTAILSFCVTILQAPFNAAIIAHEEMKIYAFVSIIEAILKLSIAFLLIVIPTERLAAYGILILAITIIIAGTYIVICLKKFKECSMKFRYIPPLFKEMSKFAGWNMFGSIAWLIRGQGMGIILNLFFGPALNAAKGISDQVSHAVSNLSNNFQVALNPQITKYYASKNIIEMEMLTYRGIKFSTLLVWALALPIMLNASIILNFWLEDIPPYASIFMILVLLDCVSGNIFGVPLMNSLAATGNIKNYQITVSCVLLLILPSAYFSLKAGCAPETIFYLNILFNFLSGLTRFFFCKKQIGYSLSYFFNYALFPILCVVFLSVSISFGCKILLDYLEMPNWSVLIISSVESLLCVVILSWYIGLNSKERIQLKNMIINKLRHNG